MKKELAWVCGECEKECWPIRSESRCLCGHRLKDHASAAAAAGAPRTCNGRGCACRGFFFVPAEGAWTLRCRCKHKAVEHCAVTHACTRCKGSNGSGGTKGGGGSACARFDAPWMCNCDHGWAAHRQVELGACGSGSGGGRGGDGISSTNTGEAGNNSGSEESALTAAAAVAAAAAAELEQMCVVMRGRDVA